METVHNPHLGDANEFLSQHLRLVHYIARKFQSSSKSFGIDHDDLTSNGMIGLVKAYRTFEPSHGVRWATYATRVITNEMLMHLRRNKRHRVVSSLDGAIFQDKEGNELSLIDVLEGSRMDDTRLHVVEFVENLSERDKQIIQLRGNGVKQHEVAELLNVSQSYISRLQHRIWTKYQSDWRSSNVGKGRPVQGDVELAKQLICEGEKTDWEIVDESQCSVSRIRAIRKELQTTEPRLVNTPSAKPQVIESKETLPVQDERQADQQTSSESTIPTGSRAAGLSERLSSLKSKVLDIVVEIDDLKHELKRIEETDAKLTAAIRSFMELVG